MRLSYGKYGIDVKFSHAAALFFPIIVLSILILPAYLLSINQSPAAPQVLALQAAFWLFPLLFPFAVRFAAKMLGYKFAEPDLFSLTFLLLVGGMAELVAALAAFAAGLVGASEVSGALLGLPLGALMSFAGLYLAFNFDSKGFSGLAKNAAVVSLLALLASELAAFAWPGSSPAFFSFSDYGVMSLHGALSLAGNWITYSFYLAGLLLFLRARHQVRLLQKAGAIIYISIALRFIIGAMSFPSLVLYTVFGGFLCLYGIPAEKKEA